MLEFIADCHVYLVDGTIVPSVSAILSATIFKDKYKDVPPFVLERAAQFGTAVHLAVETGEWLHLNDEQYKVYENYLELVRTHKIEPYAHEQMVHYGLEYAGTYDMEAVIDGLDCLVDIKTTYNLDREYLSWQLSLYEYGKGKKFDKLMAIWLPKRKGAELVEIERKTEQQIKELLEVYYGTINSD